MPSEHKYDHSKIGRALNATAVGVLKTDLDTGLTFARIAENATDARKKRRNRKNARKAYDSIVDYEKRLELTAEERRDIGEKLGRLKSALIRLGERF